MEVTFNAEGVWEGSKKRAPHPTQKVILAGRKKYYMGPVYEETLKSNS